MSKLHKAIAFAAVAVAVFSLFSGRVDGAICMLICIVIVVLIDIAAELKRLS